VFPGGTHNRFSHSLGVMYLSGKYMKNLFRNTIPSPIDFIEIWKDQKKYIQIARIAGLLHDIGHGPFSHAYDHTIYKKIYGLEDGGHDEHRHEIIGEKLEKLIEACGVSIEDIHDAWEGCGKNTIYGIIHSVVQGPLGADRMDFTLRDSYNVGMEHFGTISPQRILSNCYIHTSRYGNESSMELVYNFKVLEEMIQALDGRFRMYDCVYLHKSVFASRVLIEAMIESSYKQLRLVERTKNLDEFLYINDHTIIGEIMASDLDIAKEYCKRYLSRDLPKLLSEDIIPDSRDFDPTKYMPTKPGIMITTRSVIGVDYTVFEKNNIRFLFDDNIISCEEVLNNINYKPPREPFYYIRVYEI
jgi:hypothetical protein